MAEVELLNMGAINKRLGLVMSAGFVIDILKVPPAKVLPTSKLWTPEQCGLIGERLGAHAAQALPKVVA